MNPRELSSMQDLLQAMWELELALADFYKLCSTRWPADNTLWDELATQEEVHANHLSRMAELVAAKPDRYFVGRFLTPTAVRTFIKGVRADIEKLKTTGLDRKVALGLARDYEQSIIESRYSDVLRTEESECRNFLKEIVAQTAEHRRLVVEKLASLSRG